MVPSCMKVVCFSVLWDCGNVEYAIRMDAGKYDLQIVDFAMPSTEKPLTKKLFSG